MKVRRDGVGRLSGPGDFKESLALNPTVLSVDVQAGAS